MLSTDSGWIWCFNKFSYWSRRPCKPILMGLRVFVLHAFWARLRALWQTSLTWRGNLTKKITKPSNCWPMKHASVGTWYEKMRRFWINSTIVGAQTGRRSRADIYTEPHTHDRFYECVLQEALARTKKCQTIRRNAVLLAHDTLNWLHMIVTNHSGKPLQHAHMQHHTTLWSRKRCPHLRTNYT